MGKRLQETDNERLPHAPEVPSGPGWSLTLGFTQKFPPMVVTKNVRLLEFYP